MARKILVGAEALVTVLFLMTLQDGAPGQWLGWFVPMILLVLVAINEMDATRLVSWIIFAVAFFGLLVVLSAFTLRWRLETDFHPAPFYRGLLMYTVFVYISLGQLKIYVGGSGRKA